MGSGTGINCFQGIRLLRRIFLFFSVLFLFKQGMAQVTEPGPEVDTSLYYISYIPKYSWSVGIEHSYIPVIFTESAYLPDNIEVSFWLKQQFYFQVGVYTQPADTIPGLLLFSRGFAAYAGVTMKLFLFRNAYFTPSLNLCFDKYPRENTKDWSLTIGPTASFEYFILNRFSLRADLFNVNIGFRTPDVSENFPTVTIHRLLGLGIRYNFDLK